MKLRSATAALVVVCLAGCGVSTSSTNETSTPSVEPVETTSVTTASPPVELVETPEEPELRQGIDASHHQGPIDWAKVADHGISFAYLKASEGTGFVDPRFAGHRTEAAKYGIAVAGYHYFQLCSDGAAQAAHFIDVLGKDGTDALAPALDLELAGSCTDPPARGVLLAEVREFLAELDKAHDSKTVVYLYPEFEERFHFSADLGDHPQWVRRLGDREPGRPWQIWQYDDHGSVPGIAGPADLNLMQPAS